jgi:putative NIF3 family GTP cyclohydrolase 1 type 2
VQRPFTILALTALVAVSAWARADAAPGAPDGLTARQVVERIKAHVGIPWMAETVDTFKAGDPDTPVTGVAVTMMATLDVIQRAAAAGANLVITHEPTFYDHQDQTGELEREHDPVYRTKAQFITAHHMVVWRFHDHWHRMTPDGVLEGMTRALGWTGYRTGGSPNMFVLPETTLSALAADISRKLDARTLRVVGDPAMSVTKVGLAPGFAGFVPNRHVLQRDDVQVEVIGEAREWEGVEYAADAVTAGFDKALIVVGHIPSEQAGMDYCAEWLKGFVTEVPVTFVPAKQAFWSPKAP